MTTLAAEIQARKDGDAKLQSQLDALTARVSKLEQAAVPAPSPTPTPLPGPAPVVKPFMGTPAQLATLCSDESVDIIDCGGNVITGSLNLRLQRTRPLIVRNWAFDGAGSATPPIRLGTLSGAPGIPTVPTTNLSFEDGTITGYKVGKDGLLMTGWVENVAFRRISAKQCTGMGGSYSHVIYAQSDGAHRSKNVVFEDVTASLDKTMNLAQIFASGGPGVDGLTLRRVSGSGGHTALYAYSNSTGILVEGCVWTDFDQTIETGETPKGLVQGNTSVRSGPLKLGQGRWLYAGLADGGNP
jgi:hypothetical protein